MQKIVITALLVLVFVSFNKEGKAHGDLHERIAAITELIKQYPDSSDLYLKRGKLKLQHEDYELSLEDFQVCRNNNYTPQELFINEAKSLNALNRNEAALSAIDTFLYKDKGNVRALRVKAEILYSSKCYAEAAENYEKVIALATETFTDNYTETAVAWEKCGTKECYNNAVNVLHKGIDKLGNLVVLYEMLVEIHTKAGEIDEAIVAQTNIIEQLNRKENALYKRALIYFENNQTEAAKNDLLAASEALQKLPARIKNNKATSELKQNIKSKLKDL